MTTWISLAASIAAFGSDIYTCIVLLAYDRWSSNIQPVVPFYISRWIFAACILFSILVIIINVFLAARIYKTRNISLTYTNTIARNSHSITNYDYFCLFAKITKSRSKTELMALFVYFAYKGWVRLVFGDSPRQVINAITLYSVLPLNTSFIQTVKTIAQSSHVEAFTICSMTFSVVIWAISVLQFCLALLMTLPIYLHVERSGASGLEEYCCIRIDRRIKQIVNKELARSRKKLIQENRRLSKQPTIPLIDFAQQNQSSSIHKRTPSKPRFDDDPIFLPAGANLSDSHHTGSGQSPFHTPPSRLNTQSPASHTLMRSEFDPFDRKRPETPNSQHQDRIDKQRRDREEREQRLQHQYGGKDYNVTRKDTRVPPSRDAYQDQYKPSRNLTSSSKPSIYKQGPDAINSATHLLSNSASMESLITPQQTVNSMNRYNSRVAQDDTASLQDVDATVPQSMLDDDLNYGHNYEGADSPAHFPGGLNNNVRTMPRQADRSQASRELERIRNQAASPLVSASSNKNQISRSHTPEQRFGPPSRSQSLPMDQSGQRLDPIPRSYSTRPDDSSKLQNTPLRFPTKAPLTHGSIPESRSQSPSIPSLSQANISPSQIPNNTSNASHYLPSSGYEPSPSNASNYLPRNVPRRPPNAQPAYNGSNTHVAFNQRSNTTPPLPDKAFIQPGTPTSTDSFEVTSNPYNSFGPETPSESPKTPPKLPYPEEPWPKEQNSKQQKRPKLPYPEEPWPIDTNKRENPEEGKRLVSMNRVPDTNSNISNASVSSSSNTGGYEQYYYNNEYGLQQDTLNQYSEPVNEYAQYPGRNYQLPQQQIPQEHERPRQPSYSTRY